ncbi:bactoprenol glucosyl transferase [Caballeronia udeis]|uniref:Bactoprenol glucosyl transferase n=1 Tax=Caballeronia udeis TaxID=1232866 RepID=A0A158F2Y8_9BURK|nr:glycosyltransferase family 2 protein [Caballeronia udeis]SAL14013.1 bactoprenol glucosyl transferase [Caballeronia udeis]
MQKKQLTVVAPVFNEKEVIERFYLETKQVLANLSDTYSTRLLFVVDRCSDGTTDILRRLADTDRELQVLTLSSRFGHQMSLLAGIDYAQDADVLIMMDSDLQHPPQLIPELLRQHEKGNDIVYTVRAENADASALRKFTGNIFYRVLNYFTDIPVNANAADFRLVTKRVAQIMRTGVRERNMFLRGLFTWIGFNQVAVEYVAAKRAGGTSKYSLSRMIALATAGILSFSTRPLKLSIFVGLGFASLSFLMGIATLGAYFVNRSIPSGWTTIVMLLLLFSGVQLIVLGILGAYIGGIYEEVKARPHYIVDEAINFLP